MSSKKDRRNQWAGHLVWYYKSLMVLGEYGGGVAGYAFANSKSNSYIPFSGYNVSASYFLTGEQITRRVSVVKPKRDFSFVKGNSAPGGVGGFCPLQHAGLQQRSFYSRFCQIQTSGATMPGRQTSESTGI